MRENTEKLAQKFTPHFVLPVFLSRDIFLSKIGLYLRETTTYLFKKPLSELWDPVVNIFNSL